MLTLAMQIQIRMESAPQYCLYQPRLASCRTPKSGSLRGFGLFLVWLVQSLMLPALGQAQAYRPMPGVYDNLPFFTTEGRGRPEPSRSSTAGLFANRPIRMERYTGTPGRWTLQEATEYTYNPDGRFATRFILNINDPAMSDLVRYTYLPNGWLAKKKTISGGTEIDSTRYFYTLDSAGQIKEIQSVFNVNNVRINFSFAYTPAGWVDTLAQTIRFSGQVLRVRQAYRYDTAGRLTGQTRWDEDQTNHGTYIHMGTTDSLVWAFGYDRLRPLDVIERAYDQGREPDPMLLRGSGQVRRDSLPGLTPWRCLGNQVGRRANSKQQLLVNGRWMTSDTTSITYDDQGQRLDVNYALYNLAGQVYMAGFERFANTYDGQNRLAEQVVETSMGGYYRLVFFYAATGAAPDAQRQIHLAPNPANTHLAIAGGGNGTPYGIYTVLGKQVLAGQLGQGSTIDVSSLPPGVYRLQAGPLARQFVKE